MIQRVPVRLVVILTAVLVCFLFFSGNALGAVDENQESTTFGQETSPASPPETPLLSAACDTLFELSAGTAAWDKKYLTPEACAAYQYLNSIFNYDANGCTGGGAHPVNKKKAIAELNPFFAQKLAILLKTMPGVRINSAYRENTCPLGSTTGAKDSNHKYGCAVDLNIGYVGTQAGATCDANCKKIKASASEITIPADATTCKISGAMNECNHVEPKDINTCRSQKGGAPITRGVGGGAGTDFGNLNTPKYDPNGNTPVGGAGKGGTITGTVPENCVEFSLTIGASPQCIRYRNPYSPFNSNNGLLGGNSDMAKMMQLMMGMQLGQGLGQAAGGLFGPSQNTQPTITPTPLPPVPLPPIPIIPPLAPGPTGTSTIDALIAALNGTASSPATTTALACTIETKICPDGSSVGRVPPSCQFSICPVTASTTVGQVQEIILPPVYDTNPPTGPQTTSAPGPVSVSTSNSTISGTPPSESPPISDGISTTSPGSPPPAPSVMQSIFSEFSRIPLILSNLFSRLFGIPAVSR